MVHIPVKIGLHFRRLVFTSKQSGNLFLQQFQF